MLELQHRRHLLSLAIQSIRDHLKGLAPFQPEDVAPPLGMSRGVFVTLLRGGALRGCVGLVERTTPLWKGVRDMAVAAATKDSRFEPVTLSELGRISVEISVLSELRRISDPGEIEIGRHGIYLKKESLAGLLLPQVATERGWGAVQFLERTSHKAGLPPQAWREGAEIFVFSCEIFDDLSIDVRAT